MLFKKRTVDESCVEEKYLENIGHKKGNPSGSKKIEHEENAKEGKKKWKGGKDKNMTTTIIGKKILATIETIAIFMGTLRKSVGNYIHS